MGDQRLLEPRARFSHANRLLQWDGSYVKRRTPTCRLPSSPRAYGSDADFPEPCSHLMVPDAGPRAQLAHVALHAPAPSMGGAQRLQHITGSDLDERARHPGAELHQAAPWSLMTAIRTPSGKAAKAALPRTHAVHMGSTRLHRLPTTFSDSPRRTTWLRCLRPHGVELPVNSSRDRMNSADVARFFTTTWLTSP